jgi:hypothetical protein
MINSKNDHYDSQQPDSYAGNCMLYHDKEFADQNTEI